MQPPEHLFEPKKPALLAIVVFLLAAATLMWPMALGQFLVNPMSDQYSAGYSFRLFGAEMFRATGAIPQWNPFLFGGMPFIGAMHGDIFYPTAWLRWILPTDVAMTLGFGLHLVLAGLFMYALLRALKLSWTGAMVGGVAYQLTGIVASMVSPGHDGKMFVSALAPLAFLALLRAVRDQRRPWFGLFAIVVGLALLSPHYQLTYYLLVASGVWTLYLTFFGPEKPTGSWIAPIAMAFGAVALGVAISAIQALPFLEYIPYSPRGAGGPSLGWQYSTNFSLPPEELMSTILPQFNGIIESYWGRNFFKLHTEYLGVVVVALAAFGWTNRERRRLLWAMTAIAGLFLLIALGRHTPFYRLWYEVMPMMKKVRAPGMAFYLVALPVTVMAGMGADQLLARRVGRRLFWIVFGVLGAVALLGTVGALQPVAEALAEPQQVGTVSANADALQAGALRMLVVLLVAGALAWAINAGKVRAGIASAALIVVVAADMWSLDRNFFRFSPPASEIYATDDIIDYIRTSDGQFRVFNPLRVYDGSILMAYGIQTALGYHGNEVRFYDDLWGGKNVWRNQGSQQLWDLMAVRFVLLPSVQEIPGFTRVLGPVRTTSGQFGVLYQRDDPQPYVRALPGAAKVPDDQIVSTVIDTRFRYDQVALYSDTASVDVPQFQGLPEPTAVTAELAEWAPGRMLIDLEGEDDRQTYLLVAETWFPDWHATVDGTPSAVLRGQGALLSVALPPGAKRVELTFSSSSYRLGTVVSFLSLALALAIMVVPAVIRRRTGDG